MDILDLTRGLSSITSGEGVALLSALFSRSSDGMAFVGPLPDLTIRAANQAFAEQTGVPLEQLVGKHAEAVIPGWVRQMGHLFQEAQETLESRIIEECLFESGDQSEQNATYWDGSVSPVTDPNELFLGSLLIRREVTERTKDDIQRRRLLEELKEANRQARLEQTRWKTMVESMIDPVTVSDATGEAIYMNTAYSKLIGRYIQPELELEQHPSHYQLYRPDGSIFKPDELPLQRASLRDEAVRNVELIQRASSGEEVFMVWNASPLHDDAGNMIGAVAVGRDVTERRRAAGERERLLEQLRTTNEQLTVAGLQARELAEQSRSRTTQMEEFVSVVSHDLRTPLTVIQGQAQMVQRFAERPEAVRRSAEAIYASVKRMNGMISDLVEMGRLEYGQLKLHLLPVDLSWFISDLKVRLEGAAGTERIRMEVPERLPPVLADQYRLERIFTNLLDNALKYSDAEVIVRASADGDSVAVSIVDHGPGIPKEEMRHIFERFHRARATGGKEGLGLGLYIVKGLVEAHGGEIRVESASGEGTTFTLILPVLVER